jgi:hypothetical protein
MLDNLITRNSPFLLRMIEDPGYLRESEGTDVGILDGRPAEAGRSHDEKNGWNRASAHSSLVSADSPVPLSFSEIVRGADFRDYVWLFTTVHHFDAIVLHQWRDPCFGGLDLRRLKDQLAPALVEEDARTVVYNPARLGPPRRPVILPSRGWRPSWDGRESRVAERRAELALYRPETAPGPVVTVEAMAFRRRREVRIMCGAHELGRWTFEPDHFAVYRSPPLAVPAGLVHLRLESDGDEQPVTRREVAWETDRAPYSFRVAWIAVSGPTD